MFLYGNNLGNGDWKEKKVFAFSLSSWWKFVGGVTYVDVQNRDAIVSLFMSVDLRTYHTSHPMQRFDWFIGVLSVRFWSHLPRKKFSSSTSSRSCSPFDPVTKEMKYIHHTSKQMMVDYTGLSNQTTSPFANEESSFIPSIRICPCSSSLIPWWFCEKQTTCCHVAVDRDNHNE